MSTREPIEGAVVGVFYECEWYGVIEMLSCLVDYKETVTDEDGYFHFSPYVSVTGPLTFTDSATFVVYKPGYKSVRKWGLENCLTSKCDTMGNEEFGVVVTEKEIALQKAYTPKERSLAQPSFDHDQPKDEFYSSKVLTAEYEFLISLMDIHSPFRKIFQDNRNWQKKRRDLKWTVEEKLTEAEIKTFTNDLLSDDSSVSRNAHRKLLDAELSVVPYIHQLLDSVEPNKRPKVTRLLGEIGDPSSVEPLCKELLPEKNDGYTKERRASSWRFPSQTVGDAKDRQPPQVTYSTIQKKQTTEDVALALRSFPSEKAAQCLVQAMPEESSRGDYISTTLVGFGSLSTKNVVAALPNAKPPIIKRKLLAILGSIADDLALETILSEVQKTQTPKVKPTEQVATGEDFQYLILQLHEALEDGEFRKVESAVNALVSKGAIVFNEIQKLLKNTDQRTRIVALWALAKINDEESRQTLRTMLTDQSEEVVMMSIYGLGRIGTLEDLEPMIKLAQTSSHPGYVEAAKKSIGILVYRLTHSSENPWPYDVKVEPDSPAKKPKTIRQKDPYPNLKPGETIRLNSRMSYTKPFPSNQELFEEEWGERGREPLDPNDLGLYVLKIGTARSYKNKLTCSDSQLSEQLAQTYFAKAKEVSQPPDNKHRCYASGVLRNRGEYYRWTLTTNGSGHLFPERDDGKAFSDWKTTQYYECTDCSDFVR